MNWNFNLTWDNLLYTLRKIFFPRHKYHCNFCGYPTDDINILYTHGITSHKEIIHSKLLGPTCDNVI